MPSFSGWREAFDFLIKRIDTRQVVIIIDEYPFVFINIGRWWGNNPREKRQEEIDIVAINKDKGIFCECKWRNEKTSIEVYLQLVKKSKLLTAYEPEKYIIFSKSGFTNELIKQAENDLMLELVDLESLFDV